MRDNSTGKTVGFYERGQAIFDRIPKEEKKMKMSQAEVDKDAERKEWVGLTDADRQAAFESLPDMFEGFLHKWGWLHFSKAIEAKLKEKNT